MKLEKTSESITRVYTDGVDEERIDNRRFEITDDDGNRIGEATVYVGGYTISMSEAIPFRCRGRRPRSRRLWPRLRSCLT